MELSNDELERELADLRAQRRRMPAILTGLLVLGLTWTTTVKVRAEEEADKASFKVTVTEAKVPYPPESGLPTVAVKAEIEVKNEGKEIISISPRIFEYKLVKKGKTKDDDDEHRFLGHLYSVYPEKPDTRPIEPGKTAKLQADLEGLAIGIEKSAKYELRVKNYGKEIVVPVSFK